MPPTPGPLSAIAKSKAAANKLAKNIPLDQLESAIRNLQNAAKTIRKREQSKAAARRKAAIKKVTALMEDMGLSPRDLTGAGVKDKAGVRKRKAGVRKKKPVAKKTGPKKGTKVAPKYELKIKGETHRWTGRGRMPLVFKDYVEKGGNLDKCLI